MTSERSQIEDTHFHIGQWKPGFILTISKHSSRFENAVAQAQLGDEGSM